MVLNGSMPGVCKALGSTVKTNTDRHTQTHSHRHTCTDMHMLLGNTLISFGQIKHLKYICSSNMQINETNISF
jgi:hypothetical protein